jgi:hypothetical protein
MEQECIGFRGAHNLLPHPQKIDNYEKELSFTSRHLFFVVWLSSGGTGQQVR